MLGLRIAIAQMRPLPGALRTNVDRILEMIKDAREKHADVVVFPELAVSGYLLGDRWEIDTFIQEIQLLDEEIRRASSGITVIWGSVKADKDAIGEDGRMRKYNAARIAANGAWVSNGMLEGWIPKTNHPKYRIFDDSRHFYPAGKLAIEKKCRLKDLLSPFTIVSDGRKTKVALTVCEDLWENEYLEKPSRIYREHGADLMIDISASPWTAGKWRARDRMLKQRVRSGGMPILYVNAVGLQNNVKNLVWFDGDSAFIGANGVFRYRAPRNEEGLFVFRTDARPMKKVVRPQEIEEIHDAIVAAKRQFFEPFLKRASGAPFVVLGLSGGVDSAVSAAITVEAIGARHVLGINMPTRFNSRTTQSLAYDLAVNLGIGYQVVDIEKLYQEHLAMLKDAGFPNPKNLTKENIQARIRGASVQAAVAQEVGGVFLCNGNKTEIALNYFTLYGDGGGAAAFLGDLWKGQIYALARFINKRVGKELIPEGILEITPSAELSPEQNVDEGKGDPIFYPYHDRLLRAFTEQRWDPTDVLEHAVSGTLEKELGCKPGTIERYFPDNASFIDNLEWAWRQYSQEFKRAQTPPIFLTSRRAFGFDRRDTISEGYFTSDFEALKRQMLRKKVA